MLFLLSHVHVCVHVFDFYRLISGYLSRLSSMLKQVDGSLSLFQTDIVTGQSLSLAYVLTVRCWQGRQEHAMWAEQFGMIDSWMFYVFCAVVFVISLLAMAAMFAGCCLHDLS